MKNIFAFLSLLFCGFIANAQSVDRLQIPGKIDFQINGPFQSVEENFETYWHGRPPTKEHGKELKERGMKKFSYTHADTITYARYGKKTVATQEVNLEYRLSPEGYIYSIDKTNSRTGHRVGKTTTEWKHGKPTRIDEGGKSHYFKLLQYDDQGRIETSTRLYKRNGKVYSVNQYQYGENPKDVTITGSSRKGKLSRQIVVKYNSKKKAVMKIMNSKKELTESSQLKYNKYGHLVKVKATEVKTKKESLTKIKYKYDKKGNWISMEKTIDGLLMEKRSRTYVY